MSERGTCAHCGRVMLLKKDGMLRHHGGPQGSGLGWRRAYHCTGAGKPPMEAEIISRHIPDYEAT